MSQSADAKEAATSQNEPMRSVHTNNFPEILRQLNISLVISTYQAGKVIILRADDRQLNTHFRLFQKPMGIAVDRHKIALGCKSDMGIKQRSCCCSKARA